MIMDRFLGGKKLAFGWTIFSVFWWDFQLLQNFSCLTSWNQGVISRLSWSGSNSFVEVENRVICF